MEIGGSHRSGAPAAERAAPIGGFCGVLRLFSLPDGAPSPLPADPAIGRPARPYGPLPGRAGPWPFAVAAALLRLSLGRDRQPWSRPSGYPARQADRARAGGKADRFDDPAADRRRIFLGGARGPRKSAADRFSRSAVHLWLPVPVRLREFHSVGSACFPRLRSVAAVGKTRANEASRLAVRADFTADLLLSHVWLGTTRPDVLLGRCGPAPRPRPQLVARRSGGGHAHLGNGIAAPRHVDLARRGARRANRRLVRLEGEVALDNLGAA